MTADLEKIIKNFALKEFGQDISPVFVRTDEVHGDFSRDESAAADVHTDSHWHQQFFQIVVH